MMNPNAPVFTTRSVGYQGPAFVVPKLGTSRPQQLYPMPQMPMVVPPQHDGRPPMPVKESPSGSILNLGIAGHLSYRVLICGKAVGKGKTGSTVRLQMNVSEATRLETIFQAFMNKCIVPGIPMEDLNFFVNDNRVPTAGNTFTVAECSTHSRRWFELDGADVIEVFLASSNYTSEEVFNSLPGVLEYYRSRNRKLIALEKFIPKLEKHLRSNKPSSQEALAAAAADAPEAKRLIDMVASLEQKIQSTTPTSSSATTTTTTTTTTKKTRRKREEAPTENAPVLAAESSQVESENTTTEKKSRRKKKNQKPVPTAEKEASTETQNGSSQQDEPKTKKADPNLISFLATVRCDKYLDLLTKASIFTIADLKSANTENDLADLGLQIGSRRRIQLALSSTEDSPQVHHDDTKAIEPIDTKKSKRKRGNKKNKAPPAEDTDSPPQSPATLTATAIAKAGLPDDNTTTPTY